MKFKTLLTKRNVIIFCVGIYLLFSGLSVINNWAFKSSSHAAVVSEKHVEANDSIFQKIGHSLKVAIVYPIVFSIVLVWCAFVILFWVFAFIADLFTIFQLSILHSYCGFVSDATTILFDFLNRFT